MDDARIGWKVREQMALFSGKVSSGLPKVARRLVREVLYGVQARGSVRLSEIARCLGERTGMKKVIERLGRQLGRRGLGREVASNLLALAAPRIDEETLLVLDPTDLSKPYARKMQYLTRVRDGSKGELSDGYWCLEILAARRSSAELIPLFQELYSQDAPDFVSENHQILQAIETVSEAVEGRGIWVIDRGGDRRKILKPLLSNGQQFIVRQRGDRHLIYRRSKKLVSEIAESCRCRYREVVVRQDGASEKIYHLRMGATTVHFAGSHRDLSLVVVKGFGQKPLLLLTTLKVKRSRKSLWRVVEGYLARWRVEETIRFIKQSYHLEDIRLLRYQRLRNMVSLVLAAAYFAAVHLGKQARLRIFLQHLTQAAQRIYGVPEFRLYAIADGIKQVLFGSRRGIGPPSRPPNEQNLCLPL